MAILLKTMKENYILKAQFSHEFMHKNPNSS